MMAVYGLQDRQKLLLTAFKQLSQTGIVPEGAEAGHKDGWGVLVYEGDMPRYVDREPTDPLNGPSYERTVENIARTRPRIILAHLRKASCGAKSVENTQPFEHSQWSFAHNGTIYSHGLSRIGTENDSQAYFRTLLDGLASSNIEDAVAGRVKELREDIMHQSDNSGRTYSSLTCLLSDGNSIYAVRDFSEELEREYYTMYYALSQNGIVFCQEKIADGTWEAIPNKTLVAFHPGEDPKIIPCN